jgi:hypothetical protein
MDAAQHPGALSQPHSLTKLMAGGFLAMIWKRFEITCLGVKIVYNKFLGSGSLYF